MLDIRYTRRAIEHLTSAYEYIYRDDPDSARNVITRIEKSITAIRDYPELGKAGRRPGTRELLTTKAPFIIVYRYEENCIVILAILHTSRQYRI